ncbi:hypothetical protein RRG08_039878 [Elysia crispata]|uniref:Uncharacterized protein n=1 Tax=Elysia crispata TaxID=231223 RepID=A0AAE0ZV97_9GAST|nr:hypothetical protein RRG08_039878 [Elysia crispata]
MIIYALFTPTPGDGKRKAGPFFNADGTQTEHLRGPASRISSQKFCFFFPFPQRSKSQRSSLSEFTTSPKLDRIQESNFLELLDMSFHVSLIR